MRAKKRVMSIRDMKEQENVWEVLDCILPKDTREDLICFYNAHVDGFNEAIASKQRNMN